MTNDHTRFPSNGDADLWSENEESIQHLIEKYPHPVRPHNHATLRDEKWGARMYAFSSM